MIYAMACFFVFFLLASLEMVLAGNYCEKSSENKRCHYDDKKPFTVHKFSEETKHVFEDDQIPILLWWYEDAFPQTKSVKSHEIKCQSRRKCIISIDRGKKNDPMTRAFVFYGTSFLANDLPLPRRPFHIWALLHEESPKNNWLFSHHDGISIFNYTATFRRESHYPLTTQFIVDPKDWVTPKYFVSTPEKNRLKRTLNLAPVVYLHRDCNPPSDRDNYVRELMKHIQIDSYGPCMNNKKIPEYIEGFHKFQDDDFYKFLSRYKFHLSFENAICKDYMTEKLFRPLEIGVIPVYMGSPNARDFMPNNHSAIFVDDFNSPKDLAKFIEKLDNDDYRYDEYFTHHEKGVENDLLTELIHTRKWRIHGEQDRMNFIHRMYAGFACELCDFVINRNRQLKDHIRNPSLQLPPISIGSRDHMGCPEPIKAIKTGPHVNKSVCYWEGFHEAKALRAMLLANESNSENYVPIYLKRQTDKYSWI